MDNNQLINLHKNNNKRNKKLKNKKKKKINKKRNDFYILKFYFYKYTIKILVIYKQIIMLILSLICKYY